MNLLDQIRKLAETPYDGFIFSPHPEKQFYTHIESFCYHDPGESIGGADFGKNYEILFLEPDKDDMIIEDRFTAILSDPVVYLEHLVKSGFYGIIGRKTTTSNLFFDSVIEESI
jgi:hypothetical protein